MYNRPISSGDKLFFSITRKHAFAANGNISERASIEHDDEHAQYNSLVKVDSNSS